MVEEVTRKHKIEMVYEYKVLPPMDEQRVEEKINSYAIVGWQVLVFDRTTENKYYALLFRVRQKELNSKI